MDCREELAQKLHVLFQKHDVDSEVVRSELFMIMNDYEILKRSFEIARVEQKDIDLYVNKFLIAKKVKGCTDNTIRCYRNTLKMLFEMVPKNPIEFTADDIRYFLAMKEMRGNNTKTYLRDLQRPISSFFSWMTMEEYIARNPMLKVEQIKEPKTKKKRFSDLELEKIRDACETIREKAIVELLLSTGCRVSEMCGIKMDDFLERDQIMVHGKGNKDRIVYLNAKARFILERYMEERDSRSPYLITGIRVKKENIVKPLDKSHIETLVRKIGKRAGVEKTHPHRFRRTCATMALENGMPIEYVSKMLGHESIETTQIYLDLNENEMAIQHAKYVR